MEFAFTAEEQAFRDEVRRFLAAHPTDRYPLDGMDAGYGSGAHSRAFMAELGRRGWLALTWPRAFGGAERAGFI
jgi:alkylation response protein AidB-like acyl-CoA dehydrogenase